MGENGKKGQCVKRGGVFVNVINVSHTNKQNDCKNAGALYKSDGCEAVSTTEASNPLLMCFHYCVHANADSDRAGSGCCGPPGQVQLQALAKAQYRSTNHTSAWVCFKVWSTGRRFGGQNNIYLNLQIKHVLVEFFCAAVFVKTRTRGSKGLDSFTRLYLLNLCWTD